MILRIQLIGCSIYKKGTVVKLQKKSYSWGIIAVMMFFFFPVGIYMLVKKMTGEKYNRVKNGKSLRIFGCVLIAFALIYLGFGITGELQTSDGSDAVGAVIMMEIIFGGGGVFTLYKAFSYIKKGTKYNRYLAIINSDNNTLIDNIAAAYPTTYEKALHDLQSMIDDGYFMNAHIDLINRKLVVPRVNTADNASEAKDNPFASAEKQPRAIKCKNCGATNTIDPDKVNICEYCGSPL